LTKDSLSKTRAKYHHHRGRHHHNPGLVKRRCEIMAQLILFENESFGEKRTTS